MTTTFPVMMWNGLSTSALRSFSLLFARDAPEVRRLIVREQSTGSRRQHGAPAARRVRTNGVDVGVEAATRFPVWLSVAVGQAIDDAPERSGSENRHDDVRESKSQ
jgi:hypothetical protein